MHFCIEAWEEALTAEEFTAVLETLAGIGQRVVIGSCIGLGFHIVNQAAGSLGVVFDLSPVLSAMFPTAATFLAAVLLMRRVH